MKSHTPVPHRVGSTTRSLAFCSLAALALPFTSCATQDLKAKTLADSASPQLETDTEAWREHISAPETELAWEQIPWRPSFLTGLREAAAAEKPVLLWVMNGHPLGCT